MQEANLPSFSQTYWTTSNEFKSFTNVIISKNGFHNNVHADKIHMNSWKHRSFSFIQTATFNLVPPPISSTGHGLHFPELKLETKFSQQPGIMEVLWKKSNIPHQTTKLQM
ncbi:hypothetical protein O181_005904 [Austropuccinia psidii MF-1]|uniref:Tet-like 2OG-Fe(II) oxygenase domain-containing protein n=1 Tax=Austropuccinia psidii MF-1 TaxID=1389203 RepID=A0A9Q3BJ13_9BASI|nr:hypothetical protein [Austropuccinia psidii MF-1]